MSTNIPVPPSNMAARSPVSSPRLPSPPPIAEDQIGPTSPGVSLYEDDRQLPDNDSLQTSINNAASRRIRPGTKAEDMAEGPPLVDLQDIDSAFQLTEHLKALHFHHTHPPATPDIIQPVTADIAKLLSTPPATISRDIWLYELCRFLIQKTNSVVVALFQDSPPCSPITCSEMRASEWQYLCAVHDPPKSCAAIDYCCHTLDWAASVLTSSKMFPSRLGLGSGGGAVANDKVLAQQMKEIKNIFRRVYRIYAHAWFQHREMFWRVEGKTGLYIFFKAVCDEYDIVGQDNYTIPPEAEGMEPEVTGEDVQTPGVLRREQDLPAQGAGGGSQEGVIGVGDTTKRHRHTKSDFSKDPSAVIKEEAEEEAEDVPLKPPVVRQATAVKDTEEPTALTDPSADALAEEQQGEEQRDEPMEGAAQDEQDVSKEQPVEEVNPASGSDVAEPEKEIDPAAEAKAEEETESATTVIEAQPEEVQPEQSAAESGEVTEPPQEQNPAEGDEASKTVGD